MAERTEATPGTGHVGPLYITNEDGEVLAVIDGTPGGASLLAILEDFEDRITDLENA